MISIQADPYQAPEIRKTYLVGTTNTGKKIKTSAVIKAEGTTAYTANSTYLLKEPDPEYLDFLETIRYPFDPENPIYVRV